MVRHAGSSRRDLICGEGQGVAGDPGAVELVGELDQSPIAVRSNVVDDCIDDLPDLLAGLALARKKIRKALFEIGFGAVEAKGHGELSIG
ncbi:hypothetical protein D9M68_1003880 [compost metagenome]